MEKMMQKKFLASAAFVLLACSALCGCKYALQRGMLDGAYISTARPAISIAARDMPLMASGEGMANLDWSDMLGGLNIQMWLAVYGTGGLAPLAVVAQADVPQGWYWDGILSLPFSVDRGNENFNGVGYQACTVIVDPSGSPFGGLITGVQPAGQPQLWVARYMAARYNFNNSKIILQYMEPLPEGITSLTALPLGMGDFLQQFAQRARNAFVVQNGPARPSGIKTGYIQGINWTRMDTNFLGTVSRFDYWKD